MLNTFVVPVIRPDLIERMLETLYLYTPLNFYVIIIDQTYDGLPTEKLRERYKNLMVVRTARTDRHKRGNLGFAQATNLGIQMVRTPYFTMCNDDVEFINKGWWQGVLDTFDLVDRQTPERPCMMVNPASFKLPDWSVGRPSGDDFYIMPYKRNYSDEEWNWLLNEPHYINEHLTIMPGSVIDGVTMYCSIFKTKLFHEVGFLDEKFYPGGGEDYDYNSRANLHGYRCVGTTLSWVFHHWSTSMSQVENDKIKRLIDQDIRWNNNDEKWGKGFDIWGEKGKTKDDIPPAEIYPL